VESAANQFNAVALAVFQPVVMLAGGGAVALWVFLSLVMTIRDRLQGE